MENKIIVECCLVINYRSHDDDVAEALVLPVQLLSQQFHWAMSRSLKATETFKLSSKTTGVRMVSCLI
jgi:hypothetical protein